MDRGSMSKYNRGSRSKRPAESNFREADENTCSPCNDITIGSACGGSLEECDNEAQWKVFCLSRSFKEFFHLVYCGHNALVVQIPVPSEHYFKRALNEYLCEEIYRGFEAKMEELRSETFMLSCDLKRHADYCMQLKRENKYLLDELKHRCEPDVISFLEAKNPDQSPESVDSQSDCQSTGSISGCSSSPDHSADALDFNPNIETSS